MRQISAWLTVAAVGATCLWLLVLPAANVAWTLQDPAWRNGQIPQAAFDWHASLSKRMAPWARQRLSSSRAAALELDDISGTEWPLFSSVFYLWATEALQEQWEAGPRQGQAPAALAADTIRSIGELIADPGQADWVRRHWGDDYLKQKNLFYRMLLIAGLDSYERLSGDQQFRQLLVTQSDSLAFELAASPFGVLEDYPHQSYTVDVLLAYAAIARAHQRLDRLDQDWLREAQRAFSNNYLDKPRGLPAYAVNAETGRTNDWARGVGISMMLCHASHWWPELADLWYPRYVDQYWQERAGLVGFREFPANADPRIDWMIEVDAGPVVAGFGVAANGFGLGAVRTHGDMDRAFQLSALGVLAAWPLPDGTLLFPRLLSNLIDAPYTGEAALLYAVTRTPTSPTATAETGVPLLVWVALATAGGTGLGLPWLAVRRLRRALSAAQRGSAE